MTDLSQLSVNQLKAIWLEAGYANPAVYNMRQKDALPIIQAILAATQKTLTQPSSRA